MNRLCGFCELPGGEHRVQFEGEEVAVCGHCRDLRGSPDEKPVWVRPMAEADLELVLAWRSNPLVYEHAREQDGPLEWSAHRRWFETRPDDCVDFVVRYVDRRVGVVSLDERSYVTIYLGEVSARGRGVASRSLRWLCDRFEDRGELRAEVAADNAASRRLFERCGFEQYERDDGWLHYKYDPGG